MKTQTKTQSKKLKKNLKKNLKKRPTERKLKRNLKKRLTERKLKRDLINLSEPIEIKLKEIKYEKITPIGCICIGKARTVSIICGCVNPNCDFDEWKCSECNTKKRYESWMLFHIEHNH